MICELQIKLASSGRTSALFHSNHFIYEVEKVCKFKDIYKLYEVYSKGLHYSTKQKETFDSDLLENIDQRNEYKYIEKMKNR